MSRPSKYTAAAWLTEIRDHGPFECFDDAPPRPKAIVEALRYLDRADEGPWCVETCVDGTIVLSIRQQDGAKLIYDFEGDGFCTVSERERPGVPWRQVAHFPI